MKQHVKKPGTKLKAVCVLLIAVAILLGLYRGGRWLETRRNNPEPRGNYQERKANEATVTYDGTVYRQRKNLTSILLMGIDHDSGETGGQADFLQLIVIDDTSRTLKRLSIDRDTMTPITVLGVLGNRSGVRTAQALYHKVAFSIGISDSSLGVLYTLLDAEAPCSQYDLCSEWSIPKQTINTAVAALQKKGVVFLSPIPGTRNKKNIAFTEFGRDFAEKTVDILRMAELDALAELSPEERELYIRLNEKYNCRLIEKLNRIMDEVNQLFSCAVDFRRIVWRNVTDLDMRGKGNCHTVQQEETNIMRRILEDLYHGNLTASRQTFRRGTKYARALARLAETEDALGRKLAPEDHPLLAEYAMASAGLTSVSLEEAYIEGFRTGARIMLAVLQEDKPQEGKGEDQA